MVTHVPMAVHPNVKDVLIIGGGDGGVAKELLQYPFIQSIDVVETDKLFVDVCRDIFPEVSCGLSDPRVKVYYDDGLRFLRSKKKRNMTLSSMIPRILSDIQRGFLPRNFTAAAIRRCEAMASWSTSMEVLFMMRMRRRAGACTGRYSVPSP